MLKPSYLSLLEKGELEKRVSSLKEMLEDCVLCPHQCKVNRLKGERGYCKTLDNVIISGTESIMEFISKEISPNTYVNIMSQYYPAYKAYEYEKISKRISKKEFEDALDAAKAAGLTNIH